MKRDSRLSGVLHILLHMTESQGAVPSEKLAVIMDSHPVVVRRVLAGLRERGLVASEKGHGGGWTLARDPGDVTLLDVYQAIGSPPLFALTHRSPDPNCLVEQAVNTALDDTFRSAERQVLARLEQITLAALADTCRQTRLERYGPPGAAADHPTGDPAPHAPHTHPPQRGKAGRT